jgi:hypothetical protein
MSKWLQLQQKLGQGGEDLKLGERDKKNTWQKFLTQRRFLRSLAAS